MTYVRQGTDFFVIFCVFVASLLGGCGGPEDEGEVCEFAGSFTCTRVARPILGTYQGTVQDSVAGVGQVQLVLTNRVDHLGESPNDDQGSSDVSGTWLATFPDPDPTDTAVNPFNTSGFFAGKLSGLNLTGTLTPSDPRQCPFNAQAILIDDNRLQGTYTFADCAPGRTGTFNIRK